MSTAPLLTASSAEDILSYIPHSLGYWPRNSLVVITVAEKRLRATMRLDLPLGKDSGDPIAGVGNTDLCRDYARRVTAMLAADTGARSTVAAIYSDEPWAGSAVTPHLPLMSEVSEQLRWADMPLSSCWILTEQWWADYLWTNRQWPPAARPIADILASALNLELIYRGSSYASSLAEAMPAGAGQMQTPEIAHWYEHYRRTLAGRWLRENQFFAALRLWQQMLDAAGKRGPCGGTPAEPRSSETTGFLLASLDCRNLRDTLLVQAAMGPRLAAEGIGACGTLEASTGGVVLPAAVSTGEPAMDAVQGGEPTGDYERRFCEVLLGNAREHPDWPGLNRAFETFTDLAPVSAGTSSAALFTMLAWIEWNRGRGSRAGRFLAQALAAEPDYKLASLLTQLLERGAISRWAMAEETAWRPSVGPPSAGAAERT